MTKVAAPTTPPAPCPACDGLGWRQLVHHNGMPDAEVCAACGNPARRPCPWKLP